MHLSQAKHFKVLLKFHKGIDTVTFCPLSHEDLFKTVNFNKFPGTNANTLIVLEDLGRGSMGKAWLCVTVLQPSSSVCVMKFDNRKAESKSLAFEKSMYNLIYPEFQLLVRLEFWSGADALIMPHFCTVHAAERESFRDDIQHVLTDKFHTNGKVHNDVRWSNIGKYRNNQGQVTIVVFDLHDVVDFDAAVHHQ